MDDGRARLLARWAFALLVAACVLASLAIAGIPLAAFAFIGGAVAIGIGFGMQTLFKNLISGVVVLIERPFRLGDVIVVAHRASDAAHDHTPTAGDVVVIGFEQHFAVDGGADQLRAHPRLRARHGDQPRR